jgi:hypothetical protein
VLVGTIAGKEPGPKDLIRYFLKMFDVADDVIEQATQSYRMARERRNRDRQKL